MAPQAFDAIMGLKKAADAAIEHGDAAMNAGAAERGLRYLEAAVRLVVQSTAPRASKLERKHNALRGLRAPMRTWNNSTGVRRCRRPLGGDPPLAGPQGAPAR